MHCGKHRTDPHASQQQLASLTSRPGSGSETLTAVIGRLCRLQASCWSRTEMTRRVCLRTTTWAGRKAATAPHSGHRQQPPRPAPWPCESDHAPSTCPRPSPKARTVSAPLLHRPFDLFSGKFAVCFFTFCLVYFWVIFLWLPVKELTDSSRLLQSLNQWLALSSHQPFGDFILAYFISELIILYFCYFYIIFH